MSYFSTDIILVKRGGFCGVMGPRMSIATDVHQIFEKYIGEMAELRDRRKKMHEEKYGAEYIHHPMNMVFK